MSKSKKEMENSPLKDRLNYIAKQINEEYDKSLITHPFSMNEVDLEVFWNEKTKFLLPNSFAYIYDYTNQGFFRRKNFSLIGADHNIDTITYLKKFVPEQQIFIAFEMYSIVLKIFSPFSKQFKNGDYYYVADRIIKDFNNKFWHCLVVIEPIVYDSSGKLISYFSTVILCDNDLTVPYRSEIRSKNLDDKNVSAELKTLNLHLKNIKSEMISHLELKPIHIEILKLLSEGKSSKTIADRFDWDVKNVNKYCGEIISQIEIKLEILYKKYKEMENVNTRGIAKFLKQMDFI